MAHSKKTQSIFDRIEASIPKEDFEKSESRMKIAAKIADAMKAKGWNNNDLMEAMGRKNPSQISKWLSGTHNFTHDLLVEIGLVLDIKLLDYEPINTVKVKPSRELSIFITWEDMKHLGGVDWFHRDTQADRKKVTTSFTGSLFLTNEYANC